MPIDERRNELLLHELGRINSELATQRRLSAMAAHDLANPAQVILGLSELLLEQPNLDPVVRRRLEQVHRSAVTMSALVSDLGHGPALDERVDVRFERLDLVELATSVVERTRLLARAKQMLLLLRVEGVGRPACWVEGDAVGLERALVNLLGNAIKFSPTRSTVTVTLDQGCDRVRISVADQGPGITREGRDRIFEVFQREEHTAHLPGHGLGLFISRQIVERHGGTVSVESEPGHGATFVLELPLEVQDSRTG